MVRRVCRRSSRLVPALPLRSHSVGPLVARVSRPRSPIVTPAPAAAPSSPIALAPRSRLPAPVEDPVVTLIASSDRHFKAGQKELEQGHFEAAKQEFNRAVDVLLESPYGARTEPRIREHFDRLVDRISTYEVKALAEGDGFTEKKYEPASIDELLALSTTFVRARRKPELKAPSSRICRPTATTSPFRSTSGSSPTSSCSRAGSTISSKKA